MFGHLDQNLHNVYVTFISSGKHDLRRTFGDIALMEYSTTLIQFTVQPLNVKLTLYLLFNIVVALKTCLMLLFGCSQVRFRHQSYLAKFRK